LFGPLDEKAKALSKERYPRHRPGTVSVSSSHGWYLGPLKQLRDAWWSIERYRRFGPDGTYDHFQGPGPQKDTYWDFLPDGKDKGRLFVLSRAKYYGVFDVWDGKGTWSKEDELWKTNWSAKPTEQFRSYFLDPFVMYAKGSTYLFMTPSGKYYLSEDPIERDKVLEHSLDKGRRNAHPHWKTVRSGNSEEYPAHAVIVDVDADETYVFLRPPKEVDDKMTLNYFALSDQPEMEAYSRAQLKPVTLDEPLMTLVQYTQFLMDKGKIRIK
jgi:hypothetical protein